MVTIRIKATRQVTDMVPAVANRMIAGGTAELVDDRNKIESTAVVPRAERAVAPAQAGPAKKTRKSA
jgi:hypothetical protein